MIELLPDHIPASVTMQRAIAQSAAGIVGCKLQEVFLASTGVIGEPLPADKVTRTLDAIAGNASATGWRDAAQAIMTTDTFPKLATASARIGGHRVTINGIAKGSGMIAPDMATMLAFVMSWWETCCSYTICIRRILKHVSAQLSTRSGLNSSRMAAAWN